jgi:DNA-binding CsgD family transcriptional regulator
MRSLRGLPEHTHLETSVLDNGLGASDLRSAYALVDDCRDLGFDCRAWQELASQRLRALLGAQVIITGNFVRLPGSARPKPLWGTRSGWAGTSEQTAWETYVAEVPVERTPEYSHFTRNPGSPLLATRDCLWDRSQWHRSPTFNQRHRAAGIDDYIMSIHPLSVSGLSGRLYQSIWVHRAISDRPFGRREATLLGFVHAQLARHVGAALASAAEPDTGTLSPRRREVLSLLLRGDSEKQIASTLHLSRPTVHEHVSALYRHFMVSSRPELMARFVGRVGPRCVDGIPSTPSL